MKISLYKLCMFAALLIIVIKLNGQHLSVDDAYIKLEKIKKNYTSDQQILIDLKQLLPLVKTDSTKLFIEEYITGYSTYIHPDTALIYGEQALQLAQKINSIVDIYYCYSNLGEALRISGEYPRAIENLLKALAYCEKTGNRKELAFLYSEIGVCYSDYGDYQKAQEALFKALSLVKNPAVRFDSSRVSMFAAYLAEVYERKSQLDSALYYGHISYRIDSVINRGWAWPKIVLGDIYAKKNNNSVALAFYKKALLESGRKDSIDIYNGIAKIFVSGGKKDSAIYFASAALLAAKSDSYLKELLESSNILSKAYESSNKDSTINFLRLSITIKDSVFSQAKAREIQGFYFNNQIRQQELKAAEQSYQNKIRLYILIGILIIILLVAIILLRNNRHKQKAYNLLQKQKEETDEQKRKAESALSELKSTQQQLIQSEKMASLGELTAGIAHEIQNPLNFVNNFSDVNKELLEELKEEADKGNIDEVKAIANDVIDNEEKINHHGKRADNIVKGMLQHSRANTGKKEATDINALADEYLRLSYHGLRAKDKSFNANFKTDFNESIGKIEIIPQDIGRVLLNLFNNAFYAASLPSKGNASLPSEGGFTNLPNKHEPTVLVKTSKIPPSGGRGAGVLISVRDNGPGIPQKIVDKIFQPFFTTKPTGQGTGLGLSLSYDIIKAHGGELKVETKESEGAEFIIQLPSNSDT